MVNFSHKYDHYIILTIATYITLIGRYKLFLGYLSYIILTIATYMTLLGRYKLFLGYLSELLFIQKLSSRTTGMAQEAT